MRKSNNFTYIIIGLVVLLTSCEQKKTPLESIPASEAQKNTGNNGRQPISEIYLKGGKTGILLIHGYAASSLTFRPMAHALNQCGYTVYCVLLPGHGTNVKDLDTIEKKDYYKYIDKAYTKFTKKVDKVFVVGHSLGSLLAIRLSANHKLDGVVLMSTPLLVLKEGMTNKEIHEASVMIGRLLGNLPRPNPTYLKEPDYFKKYGIYSEFSSKSLEVLVELIQDARGDIGKVDDPLLVIQGNLDPLVDVRTADYILEKAMSSLKNTAYVSSFGHRFFLGEKMPEVVKDITTFIEAVVKSGMTQQVGD
jgi:carboxylesterase